MDEADPIGEDDRLDAVAKPELVEDPAEMVLTVASATYSFVAISRLESPAGDLDEDLPLTIGEQLDNTGLSVAGTGPQVGE